VSHFGPRILLVGGTYRALSVLERLIERGERLVAFIGQEGGSERDFCPEILELCDRHAVPARSGRKLGEEIVRWLEDRIRPELAIAVGLQGEIPVPLGGNCRLGLLEVIDRFGPDGAPEVALRQRGQFVMQRVLARPDEDADAGDVYLRMVDEMLDMLDRVLDRLGAEAGRPRPQVRYDLGPAPAELAERMMRLTEPGPETDALEREVAEFVGAEAALALASPREAFGVLLAALGLRPEDEVLQSGLCSTAAAEAVRASGARPRLVDVEPGGFTLSPERVRDAISDRARALLVSHPFGQPAALGALREVAHEAGIALIEDGCQSLGARESGLRLGGGPSPCVFQLPLGTPLPADGAALVTLPGGWALAGGPSVRRLGDGAAAVARAKLRDLENVLSRRRAHATRYSSELSPYDAFVVPRTPSERFPTYAGYALRLTHFARSSPEDLRKLLEESGIEVRRIHLPLVDREIADLPALDDLCAHSLLLPIHSELEEVDLQTVLDAIFDYAVG
jgi:dTDP-4-amino-4,6-dideoxygalactose transaminase